MTKINLLFSGKYLPEDEISIWDLGTGSHNAYNDLEGKTDSLEHELDDQQIYKIDEHDIGTCHPKEIWAKEWERSMKSTTN